MPTQHANKHWSGVAGLLIERCSIPEEALLEAAAEAEKSHVRMEIILHKKNLVSDEDLALATARYLDMPPLRLSHFNPDRTILQMVPPHVVEDLGVLPLALWENVLAVALLDPFDLSAIDEIARLTGYEVMPFVAPEREIRELIEMCHPQRAGQIDDILRDAAKAEPEFEANAREEDLDVGEMLDMLEEEPVVRFVNTILVEAIRRRASDIHIEPMEKDIMVRYRVDGVLYEEQGPPKHMQWPMISRLKILSNLDIAERRLPQDGRFRIRALGKDADVRVSVVPTVHGQKIVMRVLDRSKLSPNISALGLDSDSQKKLMHAIRQPYGMILVTGPTGSGKTTTLYSILQELNKVGVNIITIEDPVEYQLHRVNQIQTHSEIGLTFAAGLRSILRQDPDIVMVGEIRDSETAAIGVQAAMTGHLVLSTLHTNDAPGAVARLLHMGIEPFLIASSVIMTQAQRLYRKLCPSCRRKRSVPLDVLRLQGINPSVFSGVEFYRACGCSRCGQIGYQGMSAIMEILPIDEDVRDLILHRSGADMIRESAVAKGMLTLRDAGLQRVRRGETTIEEILRVAGNA